MAHVTFIHGIGPKPEADALLDLWRRKLAYGSGGLPLGAKGVSSSMVYWADVLYEAADPNIAAYEGAEDQSVSEVDRAGSGDAVPPPVPSVSEAAFLAGVAAKIGGTLAAVETVDGVQPDRTDAESGYPADLRYERIPLPWFIKRRFMEHFLRDVHHYLFNSTSAPRPGASYKVQDEIRTRFVEQLRKDAQDGNGGPHIVVSHSMGTVIAYDCLKRVPDTPAIDGFITIGSPLGLDEIQDKLQPGWSRDDGFPHEKVRGSWVNVYDRLDPVDGFDPFLANDYRFGGADRVQDLQVVNEGAWRHAIVEYMQRAELRQAIKTMLNIS